MKYVSIDIETTGLDPHVNQMIEFGAVIEDMENPLHTAHLPKFRALIKHDEYTINGYCLRLHTKLLDELTLKQSEKPRGWYAQYEDGSYICQLDALTHLFSRFLKDNGIDTAIDKVTVAGKNFNIFDLPFIDPVFMSKIKFCRRILDPVTLFTLPTDKEPPNLSKCAERAGLEFTEDGYHTAVSDAIMVIELLRAGWKRLGALK